jgi:hypothetical protein
MSGKESGDRPRIMQQSNIYRPLGENGLPVPKSESELAADRASIERWKSQMASSPYSGFPK